MVRTRFAPSPTGYLHVGGARTALFSWAYARKCGGKFILRIEDTDRERSTQESIQAILDGITWLALNWDEGPFYQMQRLNRYQEVIEELLKSGHAYHCYASREELEALREAQRARGEKARYDGRWRDSKAAPPAGVKPVVRLKNPLDGEVAFDDLVKGRISVDNSELDDLVLLRSDGIPTYNFGVVVDDLDMGITHVIRGDDHVNNTPRQINILKALGASLPQYAHVPMILGQNGERLSKRHGSVSVMQYKEEGYLPETMVNYLAHLGWSHGDAEIFSREKLVEWFDLEHISKSPARFNPEKLSWLNQHYIKEADDKELACKVKPIIKREGGNLGQAPDLVDAVKLLKERSKTLNELADACMLFYLETHPSAELLGKHLTSQIKPALMELMEKFSALEKWEPAAIDGEIRVLLEKHKLSIPKIAMSLRVIVFGRTQTPAIDVVLGLAGKEKVLARMRQFLV